MLSGVENISIEKGTTFQMGLTYKDSDGVAINLTNYTARMQIRESVDSEDVIAELTTENDGIEITGATGEIDLTIDAADTAGFTFESAVYDLLIESAGGIVTKILSGVVTLVKTVTR